MHEGGPTSNRTSDTITATCSQVTGDVARSAIIPSEGPLTADPPSFGDVLRGAVKIVLEDVLRVRMVYVAIYLNIDYASG